MLNRVAAALCPLEFVLVDARSGALGAALIHLAARYFPRSGDVTSPVFLKAMMLLRTVLKLTLARSSISRDVSGLFARFRTSSTALLCVPRLALGICTSKWCCNLPVIVVDPDDND